MERDLGGGGGMGTGNGGMEWEPRGEDQWSYGPGMGLGAGHYLDMGSSSSWGQGEGVRWSGGEVGENGPPTVKKPHLDTRQPRLQGRSVQVPSCQVQRHTGGRGYRRVRTRKALEGIY